MICNTGGAIGSDTYFENISMQYNIAVKAFSYKTKFHNSINKVEILDDDYTEGIAKIKEANKILKRKNIDKYLNLLARNWAQVKYSHEIFAIGIIEDVNKGVVNGGTGYAIAMSILEGKLIYVFDQEVKCWYKWSHILNKFVKINYLPKITSDFAGIGTRNINECGILAIQELFKNSFK